VVQCNNREKVLLASHQLIIADWWDAYVEAHEELDSIWNEFKMAFCSHHVPQGIIKLKKKGFQDLKQGSMMVSEYVTHFMQLSRYAPDDVDTDEKKQECFLNGLDDSLAYALEARDFENFQAMADKALVLENRREYYQVSASTNTRVSRAPTPCPASTSILHLLALSSAPSLRVFNRSLNLLNKDLLPHSGR
jgi:hypothetical protein